MKKIKQKLSKIFTKHNMLVIAPWIPILGVFLVAIFKYSPSLENKIVYWVTFALQMISIISVFFISLYFIYTK